MTVTAVIVVPMPASSSLPAARASTASLARAIAPSIVEPPANAARNASIAVWLATSPPR